MSYQLSPAQLLDQWNATTIDYPRTKRIHELFEDQVRRSPDAVALVFEDQQLTYCQLNERADHLARELKRLGVGPDICVGLCMMRSLEMVVALYAILKAEGAYVPMDPAYPAERLAFMIEDADVPVLLTQKELSELLPPTQARILSFDSGSWSERDPSPRQERTNCRPAQEPSSENLAYVIYTSGSTGKPKGVMIRHRNVANFFAGMDVAIGSAPGVWFAVTSISFDIHVLELLWTLTRGFKVVLQGDERAGGRLRNIPRHAPERRHFSLADQIRAHSVTHLQCTPSLATLMVNDPPTHEALGTITHFFFGGEALPPSLVERLGGRAEIFNMYGPTETTVWSTVHPVSRNGGSICIGRPIANTRVYILDEHLQLAPIGVPGELFIGGEGVARGYLNRQELTAERFIPNPYSSRANDLIYRTGDLARWRPDGTLEFLGRLDFQVKIRGFRIELGEIENALRQHSHVRNAVVSVWQAGTEDTRLAAWVVSHPDLPAPTGAELRRFLQSRLPEYMVPSCFVPVEALPLTPNGKVDRKALPLPQLQPRQQEDAASNKPSPVSRIVAEKPAVPQEVLGTLRLTEGQHEIWLASQMSDQVSCSFNQSEMLKLIGPLDPTRLGNSFLWLVQRHEALRIIFSSDGESQLILARIPLDWSFLDLSADPESVRNAEVNQLCKEERERPFDLAAGPLCRVRLLKLAADQHLLMLTAHHIICDGASLAVLFRDIAEHYSTVSGGSAPRSSTELSYTRFVSEQLASVATRERKEVEAFWSREFSTPTAPLLLPTERPAPEHLSVVAASERLLLSPQFTEELKRISTRPGRTLTATLLAAYSVLLHRLSGQSELIIGLPVSSRSGPGSEQLVGHFINFLPLRLRVDPDTTIAAHGSEVWDRFITALENQNFTLGALLEHMEDSRERLRAPLVSVMFNLDWTDQSSLQVGAAAGEFQRNPYCYSRFQFSLSIGQRKDGLELYCEYNAELLNRESARRWLAHYEGILRQFAANPDCMLRDLPPLLLPDGKVEVAVPIAEPAPNKNSTSQLATEVQDPLGLEEQTLAGIFCEVIGIDRIGRHESFFDVGGHSLLATKIIARVAKAFEVDLPLRTIFEAPTVAELAPHIQKSRQQCVRSQPTLKRHDNESEKEKLLARLNHLSDAELQDLLRNPNLENML